MNRTELAHLVWERIDQTGGAGLGPSQISRMEALRSMVSLTTLELGWAQSLAQAILGGYFVPETDLQGLTELVSIDNEGYLYFDGIRGENLGDGVSPYIGQAAPHAKAFELLCMTALLWGLTVQQRTQIPEETIAHA